MADANLPEIGPESAAIRARGELREAHSALLRATGGATASQVLAELAQEIAAELASHFDELPMRRFTGWVPRSNRFLRRLFPRAVAHRTLLGRYLQSTVPQRAGSGYAVEYARIAVLALGSDGELRTGTVRELVTLPETTQASDEPLAWDDVRLNRVPSHSMSLRRWQGRPEPTDVARPSEVIAALTRVAQLLTERTRRDLALLERLL